MGVYLEKRPETVIALFGAAAAGGVFVPINPLLKPEQVAYILRDCNVRILVTSAERLKLLGQLLAHCHDLRAAIVDQLGEVPPVVASLNVISWEDGLSQPKRLRHTIVSIGTWPPFFTLPEVLANRKASSFPTVISQRARQAWPNI